MSEKFYPERNDVELCVSCYYARMRTDICGIYCTRGFVEDGKCERFQEYKSRVKIDTAPRSGELRGAGKENK